MAEDPIDGVPDDASRADDVGAHVANRYAVPLTTLVAGAFVAHADQVVVHPVPPGVPDPAFGTGSVAADGDGD